MKQDLRRIHHLTEDESRMLLLFRHLSPSAQESLANIAAMQVNEAQSPHDNVVSMGSRTIIK